MLWQLLDQVVDDVFLFVSLIFGHGVAQIKLDVLHQGLCLSEDGLLETADQAVGVLAELVHVGLEVVVDLHRFASDVVAQLLGLLPDGHAQLDGFVTGLLGHILDDLKEVLGWNSW